MMDWTDRHDRYFLRLIAPHARLYTEMITAPALVYGDAARLLAYHPSEKYLALQLGGSEPKQLAYAAQLGEKAGYDEINLNVGCPSPRVSSGRFGACLMLEPALVADCIAAMQEAVSLPVTVKCRIGVDDRDSYEALQTFIALISQAGCRTFIIHARKAWLSGLSPKENREIPPLCYDVPHRIKQDFPHLTIITNGGIKSLTDMQQQLPQVDGVMLGRAAYHDPYSLAAIEAHLFPEEPLRTRYEVIQAFMPYIQTQLASGVRLHNITRHILGLFHRQPGAANWRRYLSEHAHRAGAGIEVIEAALQAVMLTNAA